MKLWKSNKQKTAVKINFNLYLFHSQWPIHLKETEKKELMRWWRQALRLLHLFFIFFCLFFFFCFFFFSPRYKTVVWWWWLLMFLFPPYAETTTTILIPRPLMVAINLPAGAPFRGATTKRFFFFFSDDDATPSPSRHMSSFLSIKFQTERNKTKRASYADAFPAAAAAAYSSCPPSCYSSLMRRAN